MQDYVSLGKTEKKRTPEKGAPKINKQLENRQRRRKANELIKKFTK